MVKLLGLAAISAFVPKIIDVIEHRFDDIVGYFFDSNEEEILIVEKPRKKHDTTKFTLEQIEYIVRFRKLSDKTGKEDTAYLNDLFNLDKSESSYVRVWNNLVDLNTLDETEFEVWKLSY